MKWKEIFNVFYRYSSRNYQVKTHAPSTIAKWLANAQWYVTLKDKFFYLEMSENLRNSA